MFEGLVRQLIWGYLGKYIKDIQKEQLKITLWNGNNALNFVISVSVMVGNFFLFQFFYYCIGNLLAGDGVLGGFFFKMIISYLNHM